MDNFRIGQLVKAKISYIICLGTIIEERSSWAKTPEYLIIVKSSSNQELIGHKYWFHNILISSAYKEFHEQLMVCINLK